MQYRRRIIYSAQQKKLMWERWKQGDTLHDIGRLFDRGHSSIQRIIQETGGYRPSHRKRSRLSLTLDEREVISRGLAMQLSMRSIATQLKRAPSTISREIKRNGGYADYRATIAEKAAWQRTLRPKPCKLVGRVELVRLISQKLQRQWSPEQVTGWLKRQFPDNKDYHVSHETIYKSLFIQTRGVLKKELLACLRSGRIMRRSRYSSLKRKGLGTIVDAIPISERPVSIEDRAVPGHWEGDLIAGSNNSCLLYTSPSPRDRG